MIAPPVRNSTLVQRPPSKPAVLGPSSPVDNDFADRTDALRAVTFYMGLMLVLVKFGMLQDVQTYVMHFKGYLLYIFGIPSIVGVVVAGGLRRTMIKRPAFYWAGFMLWLWVCLPFSSWKGDSFRITRMYTETDFVMLLVIAGLVVSWKECRTLMAAIGMAALLNVATARLFANADDTRFTLEFGTVANANDFAAHLLLTLPFLLLFVMNSKSSILRLIAFLAIGFGILVIFKTASRGALISLILDAVFVFFRGSMRQRIALACLIPITIMAVSIFVPGEVIRRIKTFSADSDDASAEALESSDLRKRLAQMAIKYAVQHPLVGVGPGQFAAYEGSHNRVTSTHGFYRPAHNSFLTAAAEMGFPGGFFFLAGFVSSFLLLNRTYREAKGRKDCVDIRNTAFCVMLSLIGYCVATAFLNFTYYFAGPALAGISISLWRAAKYEFAHRAPAAALAQPA